MTKSKHSSGFTLIEILVSISLLGVVLTSAYSSFQTIIKQQAHIDAKIDMAKDIYYYTERFFEKIKKSGGIDYEEYWNRRVLGYERSFEDDLYTFSEVSTYGAGDQTDIYSCISKACTPTEDIADCVMYNQDITSNCFQNGAFNSTGQPIQWNQIYGQYSEIFFDRNRDANDDNGDENGDGNVRFDRDDRDTWQWPGILGADTQTTNYNPLIEWLPELYLISEKSNYKERTFFRHVLREDREYIQDHPWVTTCTPSTRIGCNGTIQILQLVSKDEDGDGSIDTWDPHPDYANTNDWIDLFPPYIDVVEASFFITPIKNPQYAWNNPLPPQSNGNAVQSSVRIRIGAELSYARQKRALRRKEEFQTRNVFTTTINLWSLWDISIPAKN